MTVNRFNIPRIILLAISLLSISCPFALSAQHLIPLLEGPYDLDLSDPSVASYSQWHKAFQESGLKFSEDIASGYIKFSSFTLPESNLEGHPVDFVVRVNLDEYRWIYTATGCTSAQAEKLFNGIVGDLTAGGISFRNHYTSASFPRRVIGKFDGKDVEVLIYNSSSGDHWVEINVRGQRKDNPREYESTIEPFFSPGANIMGISFLKITDPFDEILDKYKQTLSPSKSFADDRNIYDFEKRRTSILVDGEGGCSKLMSTDPSMIETDRYRVAKATYFPVPEKGLTEKDLKSDIAERLFEYLTDAVAKVRGSQNISQASAKDLKPYGLKVNARRVMVVNLDTYRDYYILNKDKKSITIVSVFDK